MGPNRNFFVGRRVLVGLTYVDRNGDPVERKQAYGTITAVDDHTIHFEQSNGQPFSIPFDGVLETADPEATYMLKSTGESVTGVDFVASFTVHPPKD